MQVAWGATAGIVVLAVAGVVQEASAEIVVLAAAGVWLSVAAVDNSHAEPK